MTDGPVLSHFTLPYAGANRIRCEGSAGLPALSARQRSPSAVQLPGTVRAAAVFVNLPCYHRAAAFDAHGKSESIATVRAETRGWSTGITIIGRGETTYPMNSDGAY